MSWQALRCTLQAYIFDKIAGMEVSITQFRRDLFSLVSRAADGEPILIRHKGQRFRIVPEALSVTRLNRITPLQVIDPDSPDLDDAKMKAGMQDEWEQDWKDL